MIAICIGHSRSGDSGALSVANVSEHKFNTVLGRHVVGHLQALGIPALLISHYEGAGYTAAMTWLAAHLRRIKASAAVELHFNASGSPTSHGYEYLHWHTSQRGKALAASLSGSHGRFRPAATARRNKGTLAIRTDSERGGQFLRRTHCPAVIAEPFFGTNPKEWEDVAPNIDGYAKMLADGIASWGRA